MLRLIKWQMKDALHILIIGNHSLHRFNLESTESDKKAFISICFIHGAVEWISLFP